MYELDPCDQIAAPLEPLDVILSLFLRSAVSPLISFTVDLVSFWAASR